MRILLTGAPAFFELNPRVLYRGTPPLAIYSLAAILEREGHAVHVLDPIRLYDAFENSGILPSFVREFDLIGVSANSGTWPWARMVLQAVSGMHGLPPIVLGGIHPTLLDSYVLETTPASYVVRGEGEQTLLELILALEGKLDLHSVAGLSFRTGGQIHRNPDRLSLTPEQLGLLPLPAFDKVERDTYFALPVESSRGCRHRCVFCSISGKGCWRGCAASDVLDRIDHAAAYLDRVQYKHLFLVDDCFTADTERLKEVLKTCKRRKDDFEIGIEGRITDLLKPGVIECLARSRVSFLQVGVECGYDEGLKKAHKGLTLEHVRTCAEALADADLIQNAKFSYIIGFPWESKEMMEETVRFAYETAAGHGGTIQISWLILFPGSDLYEQRRVHGIDVKESDFDNPNWQMDPELFTRTHPRLTPDDLNYVATAAQLMKYAYPNVELHGDVLARN